MTANRVSSNLREAGSDVIPSNMQRTLDGILRMADSRVRPNALSGDPQKLLPFHYRHMLQVPIDQKVKLTLPYLQRAGLVDTPPLADIESKVAQIVEAAGDRIKVAGDVLDYADFFLPDDQLPYDEKAFEKRLRKPPEAVELLTELQAELATAEPFDAATLEALMHRFVETQEIKIGQVIHALRVAVTGKAVGFGMFDTLSILGRERCLSRIERALERV